MLRDPKKLVLLIWSLGFILALGTLGCSDDKKERIKIDDSVGVSEQHPETANSEKISEETPPSTEETTPDPEASLGDESLPVADPGEELTKEDPLEIQFQQTKKLLLGGFEDSFYDIDFESGELLTKIITREVLFPGEQNHKFCLKDQPLLGKIKDKMLEFKLCANKAEDNGNCPSQKAWMTIVFPTLEFKLGEQKDCKPFMDLCDASKSAFFEYLESVKGEALPHKC